MYRTTLTAVALAIALTSTAALAEPPMPKLAGGKCGILRQVPMPEVKASLYYWSCPDGQEVYFHVREGWAPDTQDATYPSVVRAELLALRERARMDKVERDMRNAMLRAVTRARTETT